MDRFKRNTFKKQQTKINWIENFQAKLKFLSESSGWKFYQQNYGDFRIYPSDNWGICFVYEYEKGLSIWKEGITIEQKEKNQRGFNRKHFRFSFHRQ